MAVEVEVVVELKRRATAAEGARVRTRRPREARARDMVLGVVERLVVAVHAHQEIADGQRRAVEVATALGEMASGGDVLRQHLRGLQVS